MSMQLELETLGATMTDAMEKVRRGEEVIISQQGRAVAKIIPVEITRAPIFGSLKGLIEIGDDFNAPLPDDELREWEK
jgi:prevent-host-death family protein